MQIGDLVIMPRETLIKASGKPSMGLIIADDYHKFIAPHRKNTRIGIMWADGNGLVDYEPREWLEVISESG